VAKKSAAYRPRLRRALRDRGEAAAYLTAALADGDKDVFLLALRHVAEAHGGVGELTRRARLNRVSLYRTLSARGNPELRSLGALLESLGLRLAIEVRRRRVRRTATRALPAVRAQSRNTERARVRPR
jgi:probable addiction module antidote protein